jgi:hypothetical protein
LLQGEAGVEVAAPRNGAATSPVGRATGRLRLTCPGSSRCGCPSAEPPDGAPGRPARSQTRGIDGRDAADGHGPTARRASVLRDGHDPGQVDVGPPVAPRPWRRDWFGEVRGEVVSCITSLSWSWGFGPGRRDLQSIDSGGRVPRSECRPASLSDGLRGRAASSGVAIGVRSGVDPRQYGAIRRDDDGDQAPIPENRAAVPV